MTATVSLETIMAKVGALADAAHHQELDNVAFHTGNIKADARSLVEAASDISGEVVSAVICTKENHALLAMRAALAGTLRTALNLVTAGHCEDKRLHWLLPYENVIYCECGYRFEWDEVP